MFDASCVLTSTQRAHKYVCTMVFVSSIFNADSRNLYHGPFMFIYLGMKEALAYGRISIGSVGIKSIVVERFLSDNRGAGSSILGG